jgi:hypothetical protein
MMKTLATIVLGLALSGCAKKSDDKPTPPAAKPVEAAKPEPAKAQPKPADKLQWTAAQPSDADKDLVRTHATSDRDKTTVTFKRDGASIDVATVQRLVGDTYVVDLMIGGKVVDTLETGTEKPDPETGFHRSEAHASVGLIPSGVLVVVDVAKVTGRAVDDYEARELVWNPATKQLDPARKLEFTDGP